jgi:tRNA threonylcarbamoyladenosine dehydratase
VIDAPTEATASSHADRRFGGLARLYGVVGAARIRSAHVAVVGVGGVGSWAVEALARSGVGRLTLIDLDHVSESNINRQVQALEGTVGQAKVIALQQRVAQIHPGCEVRTVEAFVEHANWPALLSGPVDAIIDACDQMHAKTTMAAWARAGRECFVTVGAAGGKRLAHDVAVDDLARTTHDPLLAQLRYRLRREHNAPRDGAPMGVACVFSREAVRPPDPSCSVDGATADSSLNCHGYGSVVTVTATFGLCAAGWVLERLASGVSPRTQSTV